MFVIKRSVNFSWTTHPIITIPSFMSAHHRLSLASWTTHNPLQSLGTTTVKHTLD